MSALAGYSRQELMSAVNAKERFASLAKRMRENEKELVQGVVRKVSIVGAGLAYGAAEAAWGEGAIFGMDLPIAGAAVATLVEVMGAGSMDPTLATVVGAVADSGIAVASYKYGSTLYNDWNGESESTQTP